MHSAATPRDPGLDAHIAIAVLAQSSDLALCTRGAELAAAEINASGGVNGHDLRIEPADTGDGSPEAVRAAVDTLLRHPRIHGAVAGYASPDGLEMEFLADAGRPCLIAEHSMAFQRRVEADPSRFATVWGLMPSYDPYGDAAAQHLTSLAEETLTVCGRRAFVVHSQDEYASTSAQSLSSALTLLGWQVVGLQETGGPGNDWADVVASAHNAGADLLASTAYLPEAAAGLTRAFTDSAWDCLLFIQYACKYDDYLKAVTGFAADGVLFDILGGPIESLPATMTIRERFATAFGVEPDRYAIDVYQATHLYAIAVRAAGDHEDYLSVGKAFGEARMDLAEGRLRFDERTHLATFGDDAIPMQWFQLQSGRPVCVGPRELATGTFVTPSWL